MSKPKGKSYEDEVIVPKVWEEIEGSTYLVQKEVSEYIRKLEVKLESKDNSKCPKCGSVERCRCYIPKV